MSFKSIFSLLSETKPFKNLLSQLKGGNAKIALIPQAKAFFLASLFENGKDGLIVLTPSPKEATQLYKQLKTWLPESPVYLFPEVETHPYERISPDKEAMRERLKTLGRLLNQDRSLIVAPVQAVLNKTITKEKLLKLRMKLRAGMNVETSFLLNLCLRLGYVSTDIVREPGEISLRGYILDIFPIDSELPFRIEFWGSEIESIKSFNPSNQRSITWVPEITLLPAREMIVEKGEIEGFLTEEVPERIRQELEQLGRGESFPGEEFYSPIFNQGCFLDYLPPKWLVVLDDRKEIVLAAEELDKKAGESRGKLPPHFPRPYLKPEELFSKLNIRSCLELNSFGEERFLFSPLPVYKDKPSEICLEIKRRLEEGWQVLIFSVQVQKIRELLSKEGLPISENSLDSGIALFSSPLPEGWELKETKIILLTDNEIFGVVKHLRPTRPYHREVLTEIEVGDFVVHEDYGIARFMGLSEMDGREYLVLGYADEAKLYVPVEWINKITRYIGIGKPPSLSRLGGGEWQRIKLRVQRACGEFARRLLELYARRYALPGFAFPPVDPEWQFKLESTFPYEETPDQSRAIYEIIQDMEKPRPTDRLVCGDVGYGKTEIALRAAFKGVLAGKQVAILVPTTVLALQHFQTFERRLKPFPIKVAMLSRFLSKEEIRDVLKGLKEGRIDICIGTHRLLQKDVKFKDLGLLIIDEEQRFGVEHKEHFQQLKHEIDVLTVSATPIPRTLYMSLSGLKDISLIETPPEDRLSVKVYVGEYNNRVVRQAILRELERGGQLFFVHNRISTINGWANRLRRLMPEARIAIAHGQMKEEGLEQVFMRFVSGDIDVLVCTTIIESGLDLPRANTLIVTDSHRLGLSQLYQLRGRVGRGTEQAYAYFLYPSGVRLTPQAKKRLMTIYQAGKLGAGFLIAIKDLEIRGAGNLLGKEQSGYIGAVGFELYIRMLSEEIERLKATRDGHPYSPKRPIPFSLPPGAYLPKRYIESDRCRLEIYRRIFGASSSQELEEIEEEMNDRFGQPPQEARRLLAELKRSLP